MKQILKDILAYIKESYNSKLYLSVIIFTAAIIFIEYKWLFYDSLSDKLSFDNKVYLVNLFWFSITYYAVVFLMRLFGNEKLKLNKEFWLKSLAGLLVLSIYISYFGHYGIHFKMAYPAKFFYYYTAENLSGLFTMLIPLYMIYLIFDKKSETGFYGMSRGKLRLFPIIILSIITISISFVGSHFSSVSEYYPILNRTAYKSFAAEINVSPILSAGLFEAAYMFDFMLIELFFRGFMIFGFVKLLGKNAILPIASLYAVIHFGKPLPETISSFFGAYFLGIIAYTQKNIWIGVILHCLLAFSMEIFTLI